MHEVLETIHFRFWGLHCDILQTQGKSCLVNYTCKFYDRLKQDQSYFNPKPHWDETVFKGKLVAMKIRRIESF